LSKWSTVQEQLCLTLGDVAFISVLLLAYLWRKTVFLFHSKTFYGYCFKYVRNVSYDHPRPLFVPVASTVPHCTCKKSMSQSFTRELKWRRFVAVVLRDAALVRFSFASVLTLLHDVFNDTHVSVFP